MNLMATGYTLTTMPQAGSNSLALLAFVFPVVAAGQGAPTEAFRQWARQNVHAISSVEDDTRANADLQPLNNIIGDAHLVAFGEPFHMGHEPLAMRNRLIRYAVTQLGFTAVALETGLTTSKRLYDQVLGKTTETESALMDAFSYGFGTFPENLELIRWLRSYNAAQPPGRRVHLYGIDIGQHPPYDQSVEAVLTFLDHAAPDLGRELRRQYGDVISVFRSDKYVKLTSADKDTLYAKLTPPEKDAITGKIQDMVAFIRRERVRLTAATSRDEYDWALRQALNAAQSDAFLRSRPQFEFESLFKMPGKFPASEWEHNLEMRDLAMADNLQWVQQRESSRGKILFFAHDGHVGTIPHILQPVSLPQLQPYFRFRPAGTYLRSALGSDMVVIGTYFGYGAGFPAESTPPPPDPVGMDGLLRSLSIPLFIMDLRELPAAGFLHEWFKVPHESRNGNFSIFMVAPIEAYDAILFIETITPTPASQKQN